MRILPKDTMHRQHDALSFDLHKALCAKLEANPHLLAKLCERNRQHLSDSALRSSLPYTRAWEETLAKGVEAVIALATEKSEWGQVMRTCSPFVAIVDQKWRSQFLRAWNAQYKTYADICQHELFN